MGGTLNSTTKRGRSLALASRAAIRRAVRSILRLAHEHPALIGIRIIQPSARLPRVRSGREGERAQAKAPSLRRSPPRKSPCSCRCRGRQRVAFAGVEEWRRARQVVRQPPRASRYSALAAFVPGLQDTPQVEHRIGPRRWRLRDFDRERGRHDRSIRWNVSCQFEPQQGPAAGGSSTHAGRSARRQRRVCALIVV
jgi:hypothetical protein